jgi:hypothetical protein
MLRRRRKREEQHTTGAAMRGRKLLSKHTRKTIQKEGQNKKRDYITVHLFMYQRVNKSSSI